MNSSTIKQESKERRGGKRPGAGRKPTTIRGVMKKLPSETAELILATIDANQKWIALANDEDHRIQFEVMRYLTDRALGKPKQAVEHSGPGGGPIQHEHIDLSRLTDEQLGQVQALVETAYTGTDQG